jgi:hypothetical protein
VGRVFVGPTEGRAGSLDEDLPQVGGHALGAEAPLGQRHRRRIASRRMFPSAVARRTLAAMSTYAASAHIRRVSPRLGPGVARRRDDGLAAWDVPEPRPTDDDAMVVDALGTSRDAFVARLEAVGERWTQLTFYLFDPQSWR